MSTFDEQKIKHLDFMQGIISRLNGNSFVIKGWAITIVSAVLALLASTDNKSFIYITMLPILVFWVLDSFYLQSERKYVVLYEKTIAPNSTIPAFSLNIGADEVANDPRTSYASCFLSRTILSFYLFLLLVALTCTFFITKSEGKKPPAEFKVTDTVNVRTVTQ